MSAGAEYLFFGVGVVDFSVGCLVFGVGVVGFGVGVVGFGVGGCKKSRCRLCPPPQHSR